MYVCIPCLCFMKGFYSAKESATVVLTKYFDFLCNDDCLANDWVIITILGGWKVPSVDAP